MDWSMHLGRFTWQQIIKFMSQTRGDTEFKFLIETVHSSKNSAKVDLEMESLINHMVLHRPITEIFMLWIVIIIEFKSSMETELLFGSLGVMAALKVKLINPLILPSLRLIKLPFSIT